METWVAAIQMQAEMWFTNMSAVVLSAVTAKSVRPQQEH